MTKQLHTPGFLRRSLLCLAALVFSELLPYALPQCIFITFQKNPPWLPPQLFSRCLKRTFLWGAEAGAHLYLNQIYLNNVKRNGMNRKTDVSFRRRPAAFQTLDLVKVRHSSFECRKGASFPSWPFIDKSRCTTSSLFIIHCMLAMSLLYYFFFRYSVDSRGYVQ